MPQRRRIGRMWHPARAEAVATVRLIEAWLALILARMGIVFLPYIADWAFRADPGQDAVKGSHPIPPYVFRRVRVAVDRAGRGLPWESKCLAKAFAAKMMLSRQGLHSTIHLGAGQRGGQLHAHAWLIADGTIVVGESGMDTVTPLI
ncbi:lasso peptide biosynthesis B2 protein [Granulicella tundricola]|nr:lasso peptide biosynthesis B2 protein [Granulicella tundricola]